LQFLCGCCSSAVRKPGVTKSGDDSTDRSTVNGAAALEGRLGSLSPAHQRGPAVRRQHRAGRERLALGECESTADSIIAKEALAAAEDEGIHHQPELIDEIVSEQGRHELGAADHEQRLGILPSQIPHRLGDVVAEQRRVLPGERLLQRSRGDVRRERVHRPGKGLLLGGVRPVRREDLVRSAPEEKSRT
jgi:hypothetical protein